MKDVEKWAHGMATSPQAYREQNAHTTVCVEHTTAGESKSPHALPHSRILAHLLRLILYLSLPLLMFIVALVIFVVYVCCHPLCQHVYSCASSASAARTSHVLSYGGIRANDTRNREGLKGVA